MNENQNAPVNNAPDFDKAEGEAFVGLNLLKIDVGQTDGPFTVEAITPKEFGEGNRKKTLPQVVASKGSTPYTMPIAASFQARIKDAKLQVGDTFLIKRTPDYISEEGTEGCHSYLIKITARAEPKKK